METYPQAKEIGDRFGLLKAYESLQMCKVTVCTKSPAIPAAAGRLFHSTHCTCGQNMYSSPYENLELCI